MASINNQRTTSSQTAASSSVASVQNSDSLPLAKNNNADSGQTTAATTQQTASQSLPAAPKQQEAVQVSTQQSQTDSLPPMAPKQQEVAQTTLQAVQTVNMLPTAPKQQDHSSQSSSQQTQMSSLPLVSPKQPEVAQQVVQQSTVSSTAPTPPKQTQSDVQIQVATVAMVQQTFQPASIQTSVIQYTPPPQPENKESSAFVDYSIFVPANLDNMKKAFSTSITEAEVPRVETVKASGRGTINDYINPQAFMALQGMETTQDGMVKRNVEPNEVAGGVDIASIATQPKGFDAYTKLTLLDAQFYKSEEVYKNQKTVDNERVLRGLVRGSDRLHQEMVDLQYKEK